MNGGITELKSPNRHSRWHSSSTRITESIQPDDANPLFLPHSVPVRLIIVDALGRTVEERAEQNPPPGFRTFEWDASGLASGVYFLRLEAGSAVRVRKMALVR